MCKKKALFASPDNNLGGKQRGGCVLVDWVDACGGIRSCDEKSAQNGYGVPLFSRMGMVSLYSPILPTDFSGLSLIQRRAFGFRSRFLDLGLFIIL